MREAAPVGSLSSHEPPREELKEVIAEVLKGLYPHAPAFERSFMRRDTDALADALLARYQITAREET